MDIDLLIKSIIGLIVILFLLIVVFVLPAKEKPKKKQKKKQTITQQKPKTLDDLDFDELRAIVRRPSTSKEELKKAIEQIVKNYSKIPPKLGIRTHPDFDKYVDLIIHLIRHPNTDKKLILELDKTLLKNNPQYKEELNEALSKGLNSLG